MPFRGNVIPYAFLFLIVNFFIPDNIQKMIPSMLSWAGDVYNFTGSTKIHYK